MRIIKLTAEYYNRLANCKEIMKKPQRPYYCLELVVRNTMFAIPLRHSIKHQYCFHTVGEAGIDYTKSLVITEKDIAPDDGSRIDYTEWVILNGHEDDIINGFIKYLRAYERAKSSPDVPRHKQIIQYSTLKYFDL